MNRALSLCLTFVMVTAVFALAAIAPDPASADASFKLTGGGWGHGIGLSQYGAQGYALKGWPYTDILRWYYGGDRDGSSTGMRVATLAWVGYFANPKVQVNLDKGDASRTSWTLRGWNARLKVSDDTTTTYLTKDVYYAFTASSGKVKVNGKTYTGTVSVEAESGSPALAVVKDASGPFSYTYVRYRGQLRLTASGSVIRLVNLVPMEQYLYGVVPRESPASWNAEALKAQAVAARSYAWATNPPSSPTATWLSGILHCTTYSQVYAGHSRLVSGSDANISMLEDDRTNAAVNATYSQVMYHEPSAKVIVTYFSSCSGGATANIEDVWGSTPQVYYRSVADADEASPYYTWDPVTKTGSELAAAIRDKDNGTTNTDKLDYSSPSPATVTGVSFDRAPSGHARSVLVSWSDGASYRVSGDTMRSALALKSTKFNITSLDVISRFQETDGRIAYAGNWTKYSNAKLSGGAYRYASLANDVAAFAFKGSAVRWVTTKNLTYGRALVYLDGAAVKVVSLYSPSLAFRVPVWEATDLSADTTHTVEIRLLGNREAASKGTYVGLDAVEITNGALVQAPRIRYEQNDPLVRRRGVWTTVSTPLACGGSYFYAKATSAWARLYFTGTGVKLIAPRTPASGKAWVYVDQKAPVLVDLYASRLSARKVVFDSGTLEPGVHAIRVAPAGQKSSGSTGYSVYVDAFDVR